MSTLKPMHPAGRILDGLLVPVEGDHVMEAATMSLSTPIVSTQDGPRMTGFAGKKAAPFTKGGGRSSKHPNDAKGRKRKAAKAALAKAKGGDYSNIDLAFNPREARDRIGRWFKEGMATVPVGHEGRTAGLGKALNDHNANHPMHITSANTQGMDTRTAYRDPTWTPEKGARGPAEAKYLDAKNMLAKAVLAQDDKAIKKYHGVVAKRKIAFDRERSGR